MKAIKDKFVSVVIDMIQDYEKFDNKLHGRMLDLISESVVGMDPDSDEYHDKWSDVAMIARQIMKQHVMNILTDIPEDVAEDVAELLICECA